MISPERAVRRIALMIETDGMGGAEVMLIQLAESLRSRGHNVLAVGPRGREGWLSGEFRRRGFQHCQFELRHPLDVKGYLGLRQILIDHRIQVVHGHEYTMAVYGGMAARSVGVPYVITMHGDKWSVSALRRRIALRWAFRNSAAVVAVSRSTHKHMTEALGLKPTDLWTVPNGIHFIPGNRQAVRAELGLDTTDLLIVAVGSLVERKGHLLLLKALLGLKGTAHLTPWHLAIAGSGVELETLRAFARDNGIAGRVHLMGLRHDIPNILAAADIYTMPSYWEGLPVALLEAMFAGKPIVASDISGIPEAIVNGREGLLTPPGDVLALSNACAELLTDSGLRDRLSAAAKLRATAEFGIDAMTAKYERFYGIAQEPRSAGTASQPND